ncbi:MAG: hypothetical protein ACM30E_07650, partial [Nitrososphaerales archaeon]
MTPKPKKPRASSGKRAKDQVSPSEEAKSLVSSDAEVRSQVPAKNLVSPAARVRNRFAKNLVASATQATNLAPSDRTALDECGCCEGVTLLTPVDLTNPPGASSLTYRVGTHGSFKASMLASAGSIPALATRADDDPAIALFDAAAVMLDVLTFYQERIANEGYLRTATERMSVLELAREIGYELKPGVAASTFLAFEMESAPNPASPGTSVPTPSAPDTAVIPIGTKVQSIPGQDEKPQTFETVEQITARRAWNRLRVQTAQMAVPADGQAELYLAGTATNLRRGDKLLVVSGIRLATATIGAWDMATVSTVETVNPTAGAAYTVAHLVAPLSLGSLPVLSARVFAIRQQASLFGHNAPAWRTMPLSFRAGYMGLDETNPDDKPKILAQADWPGFTIEAVAEASQAVNLDAVYGGFTVGSWTVLADGKTEELYRIDAAAEMARAAFALSGKTTQLTLTGNNLSTSFNDRLRETAVFGQSEELPLAPRPIDDPVSGSLLTLDSLQPELAPPRTLILNGKRVRVRTKISLELTAADGVTKASVASGESLLADRAPLRHLGPHTPTDDKWEFFFIDKNGFAGSVLFPVTVNLIPWTVEPSLATDELVSEVIEIDEMVPGSDPTSFRLISPLVRIYDRPTVFLFGNVATATHGETRREV